jgi:hypothetical protein
MAPAAKFPLTPRDPNKDNVSRDVSQAESPDAAKRKLQYLEKMLKAGKTAHECLELLNATAGGTSDQSQREKKKEQRHSAAKPSAPGGTIARKQVEAHDAAGFEELSESQSEAEEASKSGKKEEYRRKRVGSKLPNIRAVKDKEHSGRAHAGKRRKVLRADEQNPRSKKRSRSSGDKTRNGLLEESTAGKVLGAKEKNDVSAKKREQRADTLERPEKSDMDVSY